MRVALDWLAEFVPLPPDPGELAHRLEMAGFEDALVERVGPDLSALRVGRVVERGPHPGADRLSLCRVDVGEGEPREIVCGAPNVAAGQKVAVALPGTRLPDGTKLKRAKIRGVRSEGMICSSRELGLGDDHEGILVLAGDAPVGAPLDRVLRGGGAVLELGITPNRGDAASLLGLAREVRALFGGELRLPETAPAEGGAPASEAVAVEIDAPDACHHYVARIVRGVRVGPSPEWLRERLELSGIRSINNVVDATNYALLELGQPLHAFDLARLRRGVVRVRRAAAGEKLLTLDAQARELDPRDLVIADGEGPVALAGVMGGAESEVGDATTDVLIESAHFRPGDVRLSARRHGLHSEASYRFERGVDREGVRRAADRAARLLGELAGGAVAPGAVEARGEPAPLSGEIRLEVARANRLLGTALAPEEVCALLERVGIACREEPAGVVHGRVPSHRNDLHVHQDLTEEVARVHGYDRIPTTRPVGELVSVDLPPLWALAESARDALAGAGLVECVSFPFLGEADVAGLRLAGDDPRRRPLRLANPIREEEPLLRPSLLPSLLRLVRQNRSRQVDAPALFEVARVFVPRGEGELPHEPLHAAAVLSEGRERHLWQEERPPPLFFRARGAAENLASQMGYAFELRGDPGPAFLHPGATALLSVGGKVIGAVGELHPDVAAAFELDVPCAVLEVDLGALAEQPRQPTRVREVSRFPQVRRDLAVVLGRDQPAGEVLRALEESAGPELVSVELYDRYAGEGIPEGRVSLAFRLVFQRADRTLEDPEVNRAVDRLVRMLNRRFGGELR